MFYSKYNVNFDELDIINNKEYCKYILDLYKKSKNMSNAEFPCNPLKLITKDDDLELIERLIRNGEIIVTRKVLKISVNNKYEKIINLYKTLLTNKPPPIKFEWEKGAHSIHKYILIPVELFEEIIKNINNENYDPFKNILDKNNFQIIESLCKMKFKATYELIKFCFENNLSTCLEYCKSNNEKHFKFFFFCKRQFLGISKTICQRLAPLVKGSTN